MKMRIFLLLYYFYLLLINYGSSLAMSISALNSSQAVLKCPPAEQFIRTHMAPDFETPRLVRRLDWFQDDSLVATYQQDVMSDSSRQWWVADTRFELIRPFYSLRVSPVTPEDSGTYRCRIETDPLFSTPSSTSSQELAVLVRPVAPSSPEVKAATNHSITLVWTHNAARAHRPILRFLVAVRAITNNSKFMLPAPSNATTVIVDNLIPYTLYAFAVQAENSAGLSEFGPETTYRTLGEPPENPPRIEKIRNISSTCVEITIQPPEEMTAELEKYIVELQEVANETITKKQIFDKPTSTPLAICGLKSETKYLISIEADNGFGISPKTTSILQTEPNIPNLSPTTITTIPVVGKAEITVLWDAPPPNITKLISKYHLYYKSESDSQWKLENLNLNKNSGHSKKFKYRLVGLDQNTIYRVRISASTEKGEGLPSVDSLIRTDIEQPGIVILKDVNYDCGRAVKLTWNYDTTHSNPTFTIRIINRTTTLQYNTTQKSIDIPSLALFDEYAVSIGVIDRSKLDNSTILYGKYSENYRIILKDKCTYQSSICSIGEKCSKLTQNAESPKLISIIIVTFSVILFMVICMIIAHFARGSVNLKHLLKKKKEKCVYLEEISPLVYDSNGHEDIPVELFYGYVEDLRRNNDAKFKSQFEQVENAEVDSTDSISSNVENLNKNRYMNIGANENTRIRLNALDGSDYINANYIDSCEERNAYIATQAPLPSTFSDFWSMVWQERSNVIVCITNMIEEGKRKCDQYWPASIDSPQNYGSHQVTLLSESSNSHFIHRVLDLKIVGSLPIVERKVHQLHFLSWPDHGVPTSVMPLLNFIHYTSDIPSTGPQIVHCSAGVGRSGSYILIDSIRRHLINFRRLNVIGHLYHMRRQRDHLVQTLEQFIFCHEAIRQLIRHGITRVHSDLFMRYLHYLSEENVKNGKTRMQLQYEDICECRHAPPCSINENFLTLPGYHRLDEFIVGKWSFESEEIWRLCWKKDIQTIVLIGDSSSFWKKIEKVDSMDLSFSQSDESFVNVSNTDKKVDIKIINISQESLQADIWLEIENIQKLRTGSHTSPLLLISPSDLELPVTISTLTFLACQLETTGCIDIVQVLSAYSMIQCGIFSNKTQIDLIYRMISVLVGGTRV